MAAHPTKVYPLLRRFIPGVPAAVHVVETKAEADELIESGAFTDNANHADRDHDAPDLTKPEPEPTPVPEEDRPIE